MPRRVPRDTPSAPRTSAPDLPARLEEGVLEPRCDLFAARIAPTGSASGAHGRLTEVRVERSTPDALDLTGAVLTDVDIDTVSTADFSARHGRWRSVRITGGRLGALDLSATELDAVEIRDARIDYLNLPGARVTDLSVTGCRIGAIDLPDARMERIAFDASTADEIDTRGLRAVDTDLRGLSFTGATDPRGLAGATLTTVQVEHLAVSLAAALGIRIRD